LNTIDTRKMIFYYVKLPSSASRHDHINKKYCIQKCDWNLCNTLFNVSIRIDSTNDSE
jgi:hypothetical protein